MKLLKLQINPASRTATLLHALYLLLLPILATLLVWYEFSFFALVAVVLSKWRMFAVKPRYWLANIRANMVDIVVGFSVVAMMAGTRSFSTMLVWAVAHSVWLIVLKPMSQPMAVATQAFIAQGIGLVALFTNHNQWNMVFLIISTWIICFSSARHLLVVFEDGANRVMSHLWAIFGAYLALILGRWYIEYGGFMPQIALILSLIGYTLSVGYYIHKTSGLKKGLKTQLISFAIIVLVLVVVLSEWQAATF